MLRSRAITPGTDKPTSRSELPAGHRVLFATQQWVDRLADAHTSGRLQVELVRLARTKSATSRLSRKRRTCSSSSCYPERVSLIVTSNKPLGRGEEYSATTWSPPLGSNDSSTTPKLD
jgi:hypothetical protein